VEATQRGEDPVVFVYAINNSVLQQNYLIIGKCKFNVTLKIHSNYIFKNYKLSTQI